MTMNSQEQEEILNAAKQNNRFFMEVTLIKSYKYEIQSSLFVN
jgi:hypothetical protein